MNNVIVHLPLYRKHDMARNDVDSLVRSSGEAFAIGPHCSTFVFGEFGKAFASRTSWMPMGSPEPVHAKGVLGGKISKPMSLVGGR